MEQKLTAGTITIDEIERLFGYYAETDQAGLNAICAMITGMTEGELERRLGSPRDRKAETARILAERFPTC